MVTDDELRRVMPNLKADRRALMLPFIQQAMQEFGITRYLREAAFIAQLAHESAELRFMEEIASGAAYEGRKDLGNTQPGDGRRYKGRGPIQLTGRANYRRYGQLLGLDLEGNPTQAASPEVGFRIAALFWKSNGLNELADQEKFITITKRINGGTNGLADRQKYYARAKSVLSRDDSAAPAPAPAPAPVAPTAAEADTADSGAADAAGVAFGSAVAGLSRGVPGASRSAPPSGATRGGGATAERRDVPPNLSRGILPGLEQESAGKKSSGKSAKKAASKKAAAKKSAAKKGGAAKKSGTKKAAGKKSAAKKGGAKKAGAKKGAAKRSGSRKR